MREPELFLRKGLVMCSWRRPNHSQSIKTILVENEPTCYIMYGFRGSAGFGGFGGFGGGFGREVNSAPLLKRSGSFGFFGRASGGTACHSTLAFGM